MTGSGSGVGPRVVRAEPAAIAIAVEGRPVAQVRMTRRGQWADPAAQRYLDYRGTVQWAARAAMAGRAPIVGPVGVRVEVFYAHSDLLHMRRGDADGILKTICDGLNGVCYRDDRQVVEAGIGLHLADADGTTVLVWEAEEDARP